MTLCARDPRRDADVVKMTFEGLSTGQIADRLHVTSRTVTRARRRMGCSRQGAQTPLTAAEWSQARQLLEDGCSYPEAARTIGRSAQHLRRSIPGYSWSPTEVGQYAGLCSAVARKGLL